MQSIGHQALKSLKSINQNKLWIQEFQCQVQPAGVTAGQIKHCAYQLPQALRLSRDQYQLGLASRGQLCRIFIVYLVLESCM